MTHVCLIGLGRTGMEIAKIILKQRDFKLVEPYARNFRAKRAKILVKYEACSKPEQKSILRINSAI